MRRSSGKSRSGPTRRWAWLVAVLIIAIVIALWLQATYGTPRVRVQLNDVTQAQFAGFYAAREKGFYARENLNVILQPGGPGVVPAQVVAGGKAEVGVDWLTTLLVARQRGATLVNIAQIFQSSGLRQLSHRDTGIKTPADWKSRRIAVWFGGREFSLLATLEKHGLDRNKDVRLVQQPPDVRLLLRRAVDAAAAMTYQEYRHVLDAGWKPEDIVAVDFAREGTATLEDGLFVKEDWLNEARNKNVAVRLVRATLEGWDFCRSQPGECVEMLVRQNPTLVRAHQAWMLQEVSQLIWGPPEPGATPGRMDPEAFRRTVEIAVRLGAIRKATGERAYTTEIYEMARKTTR